MSEVTLRQGIKVLELIAQRERAGKLNGERLQGLLESGRISAALDEETAVVPGKLLELVTTVATPAVARFVAKDCFKEDISETALVKISCLGDNFEKHFLGKTEGDVPATELKVHRLCKASFDIPIIAELGKGHETTLAHLWTLLSRQPRGEQGALLVNGYANIFYVRGADGILWAVRASWYGDGWVVNADSVGPPRRWHVGYQVFSC